MYVGVWCEGEVYCLVVEFVVERVGIDGVGGVGLDFGGLVDEEGGVYWEVVEGEWVEVVVEWGVGEGVGMEGEGVGGVLGEGEEVGFWEGGVEEEERFVWWGWWGF